MKVRVLWNKPDGTMHAVVSTINANDPYRDDEELQMAKAKAAARMHFNDRFGEFPETNQLNAVVIRD
jgi:hypothetical protein